MWSLLMIIGVCNGSLKIHQGGQVKYIAIMLGGLACVVSAAPVSAQEYYARERLMNLRMPQAEEPAFPGSWGPGSDWQTVVACAASTKTQRAEPICTGGSCDPDKKPAAQTRTTACSVICEPMKAGFKGGSPTLNGKSAGTAVRIGTQTGFPNATTAETIRQTCQNYRGTTSISVIGCEWTNTAAFVWYSTEPSVKTQPVNPDSGRMYGTCREQ